MIPPSSSNGPIEKDITLGLVGGTQHMPLTPSLENKQFLSSNRYKRIKPKLKSWGSEIHDHNMTVVAFFRQPEDRILSAFYDSRHANGFDKVKFKEVLAASAQKKKKHMCSIDGIGKFANPLECFARFPGIAGCQTRVLTGETCADPFQRDGLENVQDAIDVIMNQLNFVGLMEDWNESICQFHKLFTGSKQPLQGEFSNFHKSAKKKIYSLEHLSGFKDVADTVVYEAVKLKFQQMVGKERCYKFMTWDEIKAQKSNLPLDDEGNVCQPKSCSDLGKQCGEWSDGCGKTIICGMCNAGRTGLPSTWRVKCVEGQCIDYCPPWDENGYWFLSNESPSAMKQVTKALNKQDQRYLSPLDAVEICEIACDIKRGKKANQDGFEPFINSGLCQCGKKANKIHNLSMQDFSSAHLLLSNCRESKARKQAILLEKDTQPVCCPYIDKTATPKGWQRLFTMGKSNLEGEYFEHIHLGCGAFEECKSVAQQKRAEMAVFDIFNNNCYLAAIRIALFLISGKRRMLKLKLLLVLSKQCKQQS